MSNKISIFKNSFAEEPEEQITIEELVKRIKEGFWRKQVEKLRQITDLRHYKKTKESLPGVTVSGEYKTRDKYTPMSQRLKKHSAYIALDIDQKDNPKIRTQDLIDNQCLMQYVSCSGGGLKIIYRCKPTKDPAEHRRIYDAAVLRLEKKGIKLKVDPIVKSIASLQYVSFDPNVYFIPKTKLVINPLPPIKIKKSKPSEDQVKDIEQLHEYIEALEGKDVTESYEDWLTIGMGLSYSLGEVGRDVFHKISANYKEYDKGESDEKFDALVERDPNHIERPVTLASVYQIINKHIPKVKLRHLSKKYNKGHAVGIGEDVEGGDGKQQGDLSGLVRYKLFLFKKIIDKESKELVDLQPTKLNLNAFESLLNEKGFFRYEGMYVQIVDNIVERVDSDDILRIVTRHIEQDGDYQFNYGKTEYFYSWEELVHLWREIRGQSSIYNQIAAGLDHWQPKLLIDGPTQSYIPFKNGVVLITAKERKLIPYSAIGYQIWKERILPRDYNYTTEPGMFEDFFVNVCGRGEKKADRIKTDHFKRAMWYFGYMLHGSKRQSMARAWLLYDIKAGNNGRSGKSILGQAVGKIRNMVTIDGKQVDFRNNRFALQQVTPWTQVVFIDDPHKYMSLVPLFNMITGDSSAERKGKDPLQMSLKYMVASNNILEAEGTSEQGRQFVTQLDDFYIRYGKENKNILAPIVHLHGKEFFTDWDEKDWAKFDSFAVRCLQYHLSKESPQNNIIGNSMMIRFIQIYEHELFYSLASKFCQFAKRGSDGKLLVPQRLLIDLVKEADPKLGGIQAGRVVKEFLKAVGAGEIGMTSVMVGNMNQMAYRIEKQFSDLSFGEYTKELIKQVKL
jgi:hypothetical protein